MSGDGCTGVAAVWCQNCGDCTCPRHSDGEPVVRTVRPATMFTLAETERVHDSACPLHGADSKHAELEQEKKAS